jgi:TatD DNase family protein
MPVLFDSHAHVQFNAFKEDKKDIIAASLAQNVWMILPGTQKDTSRDAVALASEYTEGVYAAVGLHPLHLFPLELDQEEIHFQARAEEFDSPYYEELAQNLKTVAIGECGLEYFHILEHAKTLGKEISVMKQKQLQTYESHLALAEKFTLPIINHCRASALGEHDAYEDMIAALRHFPTLRGVVHCFTSDTAIAEKFVEIGFFISFTGIITFTKDVALLDAVRFIPLERILIETDSPYLAPAAFRGKRNQPLYVRSVAEKIAVIKQLPFDEVAKVTTENARRLFGI